MNLRKTLLPILVISMLGLMFSCNNDDTTPTATPTALETATATAAAAKAITAETSDTQIGGRLYDKFYSEATFTGTFDPATDKITDNAGTEVPNPRIVGGESHNYRCKECHGYDYKGALGFNGPDRADRTRAFLASSDLLAATTTLTRDQIIDKIALGGTGDNMPMYGAIMSAANIAAIADHLVQLRAGTKAGPDDVLELLATTNTNSGGKFHAVKTGGDTTNGDTLISQKCGLTGCHGADGTDLLLDDGEYSLGGMVRAMPAEGYHKALNGNPGTYMTSQSIVAKEILDILAALCNETMYPNKGTGTIVKDDRCPY